jgi:hypothetical protein
MASNDFGAAQNFEEDSHNDELLPKVYKCSKKFNNGYLQNWLDQLLMRFYLNPDCPVNNFVKKLQI